MSIVRLAIPPFAHGVTSPVLGQLHKLQSCCFWPSTSAYWQPDNALYVAEVGTTEGAFFPPPHLVDRSGHANSGPVFWRLAARELDAQLHRPYFENRQRGGVSVVADGHVRPVPERRRRVLLHGSVPDVTPMGLWADYR